MRKLILLFSLISCLASAEINTVRGKQLFCESKSSKPIFDTSHFIHFISSDKAVVWDISSIRGIERDEFDYEVRPSTIVIKYSIMQKLLDGKSDLKHTINRQTLKISDSKECKIVNEIQPNLFVNQYYHERFKSKNKL